MSLDKYKKLIVALQDNVAGIERELADTWPTKVDVEQMQAIEKLIRILPKAKDVAELKRYTYSNIERFGKDNKTFHEGFETHN